MTDKLTAAAGGESKEVKQQQAVTQLDYDVIYSRYLRTRLIEKAMKNEYESRQREVCGDMFRLHLIFAHCLLLKNIIFRYINFICNYNLLVI